MKRVGEACQAERTTFGGSSCSLRQDPAEERARSAIRQQPDDGHRRPYMRSPSVDRQEPTSCASSSMWIANQPR
jgi:hypothetical protein